MGMMYSAAFGSMFEGSMCGAGANVFAVWLFALSRCDKDGDVELGSKAVSLLIGCSEDDVKSAINYLTAPDEDSRSGEEGGARLKRTGKILYRIVNYEYYKKIASYEKKKEADRTRKREKDAAEKATKQREVAKGSEGSRIEIDRDRDLEIEKEEKTTSSSSSTDDDASVVAAVLEFWNEHKLMPKVQSIKTHRRAAVLARYREHGWDALEAVMNSRRTSRFLCYEINHNRGAPIDWVFGPKNFPKILDGNYND